MLILIHLAIARADPPRRAQSPNERSTRDQPGLRALVRRRKSDRLEPGEEGEVVSDD